MLIATLQGDLEGLAESTCFYMVFACVAVWAVTTVRDVRRLSDEDALREAGAICAETIRIPDYANRMNNRLDRLLTAAPWKYPVMLLIMSFSCPLSLIDP